MINEEIRGRVLIIYSLISEWHERQRCRVMIKSVPTSAW